MSEVLSTIAPGLPAVSNITTTPFIEPLTDTLLHEQFKHRLCRQLTSTVGKPGSSYFYNRNGFPIGVAPMDGTIKKLVSRSPQRRLLHPYHYPQLAGHHTEQCTYVTMQGEVYWPHMVYSVYITVNNFCKCTRTQAIRTRTRHLKLFPARAPLEFTVMDILGRLPNATNGTNP